MTMVIAWITVDWEEIRDHNMKLPPRLQDPQQFAKGVNVADDMLESVETNNIIKKTNGIAKIDRQPAL
jgi:hypothetical protein